MLLNKDDFIENFKVDFYKTLPKIDVLPLIDYFINPKGIYEVPFSGYESAEHEEKFTFKGKLRVYGEKRYKY